MGGGKGFPAIQGFGLLQYLCHGNIARLRRPGMPKFSKSGRISEHGQVSEPLRLRFPTWIPVAA